MLPEDDADAMKHVGVFLQPPPPPVGQGLLIHEISRSHTTMHHSR